MSNLWTLIRLANQDISTFPFNSGDGGDCIPAAFPFLSSSREYSNCNLRGHLDGDFPGVLIVHPAAFCGDKLVFRGVSKHS